jgi:hypothetical protein
VRTCMITMILIPNAFGKNRAFDNPASASSFHSLEIRSIIHRRVAAAAKVK